MVQLFDIEMWLWCRYFIMALCDYGVL